MRLPLILAALVVANGALAGPKAAPKAAKPAADACAPVETAPGVKSLPPGCLRTKLADDAKRQGEERRARDPGGMAFSPFGGASVGALVGYSSSR